MQNMVGHFWCRGSLMIMLSLLNTRISRPFSSEPLFCQSAPSLFWCMGVSFLFLPLCRTRHLPMLIFMKFLSAHLSELARPLRVATLYSTTSTTPQGLLVSKNLLKICFEMPENNYRRNHLQRRVRHSILKGTPPQAALNSSCPWSECQGWLARHLLGLMSCTHVQGDSDLMYKECSAVTTLTDKDSGIYFWNSSSTFFCSCIKTIYGYLGRNHSSALLISVHFPNRKIVFFPVQLSLFVSLPV